MRPRSGFLTALPAVLTFLGSWPASAQRSVAEPRIDSLLTRMTLEEKLGQLNQLSVDNQPTPEQLALVRKGLVGSFLNRVLKSAPEMSGPGRLNFALLPS